MTLTIMLATGAIVFFGKWADKKEQAISQLLGLVLASIFLVAMEDANPKLAKGFAWLIFFGAFYVYGTPLVKALHLNGGTGGIAGKAGN